MALPLSRNARWIFIGDSITDVGRRTCPEQIGSGYVRMVRDWLLASRPADAPEILNRGISGNKVTDLRDRWDADVLALEPSLVSIKIGINDVWHGLKTDWAPGVPIDQFREVYEDLLHRLKSAFPTAAIVLCEPSVIWPPAPAEGNALLQPYVQATRDLAAQCGAQALVPLHGAFERAREARPEIAWAPDGVHPGSAGHMLIARTWLAALGLLETIRS
jgi:lysophospholipase L1-like esterase